MAMPTQHIDSIVKDAETNGVNEAIESYVDSLELSKALNLVQENLTKLTTVEELASIGIIEDQQDKIMERGKVLNGLMFRFQSRINKNLRKVARFTIQQNSKKLKNMEELDRIKDRMAKDAARLAELEAGITDDNG